MRIAIYAGHGGSDFGAVGNGLREKDLNLAISNAATAILRGWGYFVLNNRTTDVDRSITADANRANASNLNALVEIHLNSNPGTPATGSEAFVSIRNIGASRRLAEAMLVRMAQLGFVNRGVKTATNANGQDLFGILRLTNMPAVLFEAAFINNPADMARFNVQAVAMAVAQAVREVYPLAGGGGGTGGLPPYPGTAIRLGARGDSVRQIQACLNRVNARLPGIGLLNEDGIFGPLTLAAVQAFQRLVGLVPDGVVGPLTWAALTRECAAAPGIMRPYPGTAIRLGERGDSVRQIQACLNRVNARLPGIGLLNEDGIFGPLTLAAVQAFQRVMGLVPDGADVIIGLTHDIKIHKQRHQSIDNKREPRYGMCPSQR